MTTSPAPVTVITGASDGIGAAAARALHELGHTVVVVGRNPDKTAAVAKEVGGEPLTADFAELDQVRTLAEQLVKRYPRIDVLANNAGGLWPKRVVTADGHEQTFQVNHLAPFLLTELLRPALDRSDSPRVITTSSVGHRFGVIHLDDLDGAHRRYRQFSAYGASKLANILFTRELARRAPSVLATCLHPGAIASQFGRDSLGAKLIYQTPIKRVLSTPEQGADTLVWLAQAPVADLRSGAYYTNRKIGSTSGRADDMQMAERLWDRSATMLGLPPSQG